MKTACIVQARLGSSRLPCKVLLPLPTGRTVLEECLYRCRQIEGVDVVVAAIADDAGSDLLLEFTRDVKNGGKGAAADVKLAPLVTVRGPEHDVLARYLKAAETVEADVILRVTSDCPLIEPEVCAMVLKFRAEGNLDYAANNLAVRSVPHGWDCEAFTFEALRRAYIACAEADSKLSLEARTEFSPAIEWREHVTGWMRSKESGLERGHIACALGQNERWTLDTKQDYIVICEEFKRRRAA